MDQMMQQVQNLTQLVATQQQEAVAARQQIVFLETKRRETEEAELRQRRQGPKVSLADPRALAKPGTFKSQEDKWPDFSFKYTNMATAVYADARKALTWASEQTDPISALDELVGMGIKDAQEMSREIYISLAQMLEGEA